MRSDLIFIADLTSFSGYVHVSVLASKDSLDALSFLMSLMCLYPNVLLLLGSVGRWWFFFFFPSSGMVTSRTQLI